MNLQLSLLDYLAQRTGCLFLSDLRDLDRQRRGILLQTLRSVSPEDVPLKEWNDALTYLTGALPEGTVQAARAQLLALLDASLETCPECAWRADPFDEGKIRP